jgi:hypothetical protein
MTIFGWTILVPSLRKIRLQVICKEGDRVG